ncbi:hypothetical protein LTR36_010352 [Oleoguttula mirabilis]|uniref:Uncharacterized protein n=1 Tax=Oleoguttula mirabilis TaxID=1507867 RepID=A0AAV9J4I4_9PEZI|nr:hypothetical protein LTR36_010352 [Oleoguttula mirabilis]
MAEAKPTPPPRPTASSSGITNAPPSAAMRHRLLHQQSNRANSSPSRTPPTLPRRRSSILSYTSLDGSTHSWADDIINPKTGRRNAQNDDHEVTHWHSSPIAFAILPALGGLLFKNGSAVVTDGLLLTLAAVFMNWSIRLPWDWYYSAQATRLDAEPYSDTILEEDEVAVETASSGEGSPQHSTANIKTEPTNTTTHHMGKREEAATALRRQELWALLAIFVFPPLAAYLLHIIRAQLSRPATGLISDSNLSIFLLAAEVRPCIQLVRLLATRTLHLQRTVSGLEEPFASASHHNHTLTNLTSRLADLEARLSDHTMLPPTVTVAHKADVTDLSAELRKRYEPRLEGLERAVRRYEKRSATQTLLTDHRLLSLENRLQDALSLAAVAAQHSQRPGVVVRILETASQVISWPVKVAWTVWVWPLLVVEDVYERAKGMMLGPYPMAERLGGGKRKVRSEWEGPADDKARAKTLVGRKVVR